MKFHEIAKTFNQIEKISSRIEITRLLSELFKQLTPIEAKIVSYFALGLLNPPYIGTKFNFAEKSIIKVIAKFLDISQEKINEEFKKLGDLGLVIEEFSQLNKSDLTIEEVYQKLKEIEKAAGVGSNELKQEKVLELLKALDNISAKFIIRILNDSLRLGFSDMTLLDAISWMLIDDKSLKSELENEYNLCADIGLIVFNSKNEGIKSLKKMSLKVGIPIRMAAAERMSESKEVLKKLGPCVAQPKLDGFRLQVHLNKTDKQAKVWLFSRNLIDMSEMFPEIVKAFKNLNVLNIICEGEAVAYDPNTGSFFPFQETVKRKRKHGIKEISSELPLKLFMFDLLYYNNELQINLSHEERRARLLNIFRGVNSTLSIIDEKKINNAEELDQYFIKNIHAGLEGLVVKRSDASYQPGKRNFNWIKLKRTSKGQLLDTIDCVILGYYHGSGKRVKFGVGAFLVGIYDKSRDLFQTIAKVGTGMSDQEWKELKEKCDKIKNINKPTNVECGKNLEPDVWIYPEIVCEIFADEITLSPIHTAGKTENNLGYALRFPRFIGYRPDKDASETTSIKELKEIYAKQYNRQMAIF